MRRKRGGIERDVDLEVRKHTKLHASKHAHTPIHARARARTLTHTRTHACARAHAHSHAHTNTRTHAHSALQGQSSPKKVDGGKACDFGSGHCLALQLN